MNQVELQGEAYLCFSEDLSWFQGNISTNDESNYSIYGEKCGASGSTTIIPHVIPDSIPCTPQESDDEDNSEGLVRNNTEVEELGSGFHYKATLTDHFTGLSHNLPIISLRSQPNQLRNESLFDSLEGQVEFKVMNMFKGQKADMVIQHYLGSPSLLGQGCLVYSGLMDIDFSEVVDYGKSWSL